MAYIYSPFNDCSQSTVETNPEVLLMTAEQDEEEADVAESFWLAGLAVTKPQSNDY